MWPAMDHGNRGVFIELGKSETDWESSWCTKWSDFKEKERKKKNKKREGEEKKKEGKEKRRKKEKEREIL